MADDRHVCLNAGCNCPAAEDDGSDYCGQHCESGGGMTEIACGCGHPECQGEL